MGRLSVNTLLKSVFAAILAVVMTLLVIDAWTSWGRLEAANRIRSVVEASDHIFTALHNLRSDRLRTNWGLQAEKPAAQLDPMLLKMRGIEVKALASAVEQLRDIDFPKRAAVVNDLEQKIKKLTALHAQSAEAFLKPKDQRPPNLAKEAVSDMTALIDLLDQLSSDLNRLVKLDDALVDQLLQLKSLGWVARNSAGEATSIVTAALTSKQLPNDAFSVTPAI